MRLATLTVVAVLSACTSGESNPSTLWFAMNADETQMQLVGIEPHPF
jgi:hypothetical protein